MNTGSDERAQSGGPSTPTVEIAAAPAAEPAAPAAQTSTEPAAEAKHQTSAAIEGVSADAAAPGAGGAAQGKAPPSLAQASKAADASGEAFAVYLSNSVTVADARASLAPLQKRYPAELKGRKLSFHRVKLNGATVYRVRVGRLGAADAADLCSKLQTAGAACEVGPE